MERLHDTSYGVRILAAHAVVILILIGLVHLPGTSYDPVKPATGLLPFQIMATELSLTRDRQEGVVSQHNTVTRNIPVADEDEAPGESTPVDQVDQRVVTPLEARALEHERPSIIGGPGAYYINIEYPEAAIRNNIQGRLILQFVVDTEGIPRSISVVQSLHPLCDSAAVAALRQTRFIPGRRDNTPIDFTMKLPVLFELVGSVPPSDG